MIKKDIVLNSQRDVLNFVNVVCKYSCDVDMHFGHNMIDAKSILGVLGVGIGKKVELMIHADEADDLIEDIDGYAV